MDGAVEAKSALRRRLRSARRAYVGEVSPAVRALLFFRPPRAVAARIDRAATVAVYCETDEEAPASGYARWFFDEGHPIALPWFAGRESTMAFRLWANPHDPALLEPGPWGLRQPAADAPIVEPDVAFVPLVGFSADGSRLGMGAGHYDRWLGAHPAVSAFGLAWDCQEEPSLPSEPHDRPLVAVITPTRVVGPFDRAGDERQ